MLLLPAPLVIAGRRWQRGAVTVAQDVRRVVHVVTARTFAYPALRTSVAGLGAVLAAGWLANRVGLLADDPLEPVGNLLVDHPLALAGGLGVLALALTGLRVARSTGASRRPAAV